MARHKSLPHALPVVVMLHPVLIPVTITVMGSGVQVSNSVSCQDTWACCHVTAYCFSKDDCK